MSAGAVDVHGHYFPPAVMSAVADGRVPGVSRDGERLVFRRRRGLARTRPMLPALADLEQRRAWMTSHGVATQLVAPEPETYGYELSARTAGRWCRLVNEAMAADLAGAPELAGLAVVPLQDGAAAAAELRDAVERLGLRGCMLHTAREGGFDDPGLDPFWEAAAGLGAPVVIHPANPDGDPRLTRYYLANAVGRPFETAIAAAHLLCGGVFDRHPELCVVLVHGGGALPYQVHRLDQARLSHPEGWGAREAPSAYFGRLYFDSILFAPAPLRYLIDRVGAEHVLLGSDFPFSMADLEPLTSLRAAELPAEAEAAIAGGNARRLFGLDRPAGRGSSHRA